MSNTQIDTVALYRKTAKEYLDKNYPDNQMNVLFGIKDRSHIEDLAASVIMTRDRIMLGGSFVRAIVNNDLNGAVERADLDAARALKIFVQINKYCTINAHE